MAHEYRTDMFTGVSAETISVSGHNGDVINAYYARPPGAGPFPGVVLVHHLPGWDEFYRETARRFADHGYIAICPNLYYRTGHGTPEDIAATVRSEGGVPDDQVVGDLEASAQFLRALPQLNGKVGVWGTCSGGRHAYLAATRTDAFDAIANLWGGGVVAAPEELNENRPVAPIDYTADLNVPILGLFGNDDQSPTPAAVDQLEEALKSHGKNYEFHRYDGAGHGFFYWHAPMYRQEQAMDGWSKVWDFFDRNLS